MNVLSSATALFLFRQDCVTNVMSGIFFLLDLNTVNYKLNISGNMLSKIFIVKGYPFERNLASVLAWMEPRLPEEWLGGKRRGAFWSFSFHENLAWKRRSAVAHISWLPRFLLFSLFLSPCKHQRCHWTIIIDIGDNGSDHQPRPRGGSFLSHASEIVRVA